MEEVCALIEDAVAGGPSAWQRFWLAIEPGLWDLVDQPRFACHLTHREEGRTRIVGAIHDHLAADRCHHLQLYLDARRVSPQLGFARWLHATAKRIAMNYASYDVASPAPLRRRSARRLHV